MVHSFIGIVRQPGVWEVAAVCTTMPYDAGISHDVIVTANQN